MMKSRPCASSLRPSRLCRLLLLAVSVKLCLLGGLILDPLLDAFSAPQAVPSAASSAVPAQAAVAEAALPEVKIPLSRSVAHAAPAPQAAPAQAAPEAGSALARDAQARRQEEMARKEQDLRALEKDLDERLEKLQLLEARLQRMLKEAAEVKSDKFRQLIDVLSNMKAKQAAGVLETLDEKVAVKVLSGMRGRQAGEILTYVDSKKAARLAESLARMQMPFE